MGSRIPGCCLLAAVLGAGCSSYEAPIGAARTAPAQRSVLRIGVTPNYPPLVFKREGAVVGVEADFAARLGEYLRQKVELVELPWAALIPALQQGRIDIIMSGMSITPERERAVLFTEPYLRAGQMAIIRAKDAARFGQPSALSRGRWIVGYEEGTTGARFVQDNLRQATGVAFPSAAAGLRALRAGEIDVFIHDAPTAWRIAEDRDGTLLGLYRPLTEEHLAWAVRKSDAPLRQQLNAALTAWRLDGTLQAILDRWIKVQVLVR
jgi:ABC-type amino acid transport substrate-binding protein